MKSLMEKKQNNYSNGSIMFEGEYLNGMRWNGKGKEYSSYSKLLFEGEYLNGKKKIEKEKKIILMINYLLKKKI